MPIGAWNCPVCSQNDLPLDHFKTSKECGEQIHPDYADAVLRGEHEHYRFGTRDIGVTDLIGCPRSVAGSRDLSYSVNPKDMMAMSNGTAWDQWVTAGQKKEALHGTLGGIEIIGEPDRMRDEVVEDCKRSHDFSASHLKGTCRCIPQCPGGAKPDHRCQVSLYAHLKRQSGEESESGRIWYQFSGDCLPFPVSLMSESEILEYKPVNGETTITAHLALLNEWKRGNLKWEDMPLTGEQQSYGKKSKCDYCSIAGPCREEATGAPY